MHYIRHIIVVLSEITWWCAGLGVWVIFLASGWQVRGIIGMLVGGFIGGVIVISVLGLVLTMYEINGSLRVIAGSRFGRRKRGGTNSAESSD